MKKDMNIRGIDGDLIRDFRIACLSNDLDMKEVVVKMMKGYIKQSLTRAK